MKYRSVFEIIGPVMIGPSSSHTAGAARIGLVGRQLFEEQPDKVTFHLYGSFAKTYQGHGTDVALLGGILGYDTSDQRLTEAFAHAEAAGIAYEFVVESDISHHPNTVKIVMEKQGRFMSLVGISIGGGKVEIKELNGFDLRLSGNHPAILVVHDDRYGAIASVSSILASRQINIGHMEVSRKEEGKEALMIIEIDQNVPAEVMEEISQVDQINQVTKVHE